MKIIAVVDVHPLNGGTRGLFARVESGANQFDLPLTKDQAGMLLANMSSLMEPEPPKPKPSSREPTIEESNLFAQFTSSVDQEEDYGDDSL